MELESNTPKADTANSRTDKPENHIKQSWGIHLPNRQIMQSYQFATQESGRIPSGCKHSFLLHENNSLFPGRSLGKYFLCKVGKSPALGNCNAPAECRKVYLSGATSSFAHLLTRGSPQPALLTFVLPWFWGGGGPTQGDKKTTAEGLEAGMWAQRTGGQTLGRETP